MPFRFFSLVLIIGFLLSSFSGEQPTFTQASQVETAPIIALINGQVIDGTGAEPIANGGVLIEDSRIIFVGTMDEIELTEDMVVLDVAARTILPGIFNAHTHGFDTAVVRQLSYLNDGVTSLCNMAIRLNKMESLEVQTLPDGSPSTNSFQAGPIVTVPDGYPGPVHGTAISYEISGETEAGDAVLDLKEPDYIKIALEPSRDMPVLSLAEVEAIVTAAHENDMLVHAHIQRSSMLDVAIEGGVDVFQHVPMPYLDLQDIQYPAIQDYLDGETKHIALPPEFEAQLLQAIEHGIIFVPTLDVYSFRSIPDELR